MYRIALGSFRISIFCLLALLIGACASTPDVYTNVDRQADFGQFKTFGFFDPLATDRSGYETTESRYLKAAVEREMKLRDIRLAEDPDLRVNFFINTNEKVQSRSSPTAGAYYGYRGARYGAWGGYETTIDQYTEGTLNIDIVDTRTNRLVWEGTIVGKVTDEVRNNLEAVADEAVREIFTRFPVPPVNITPASEAK